MEQEIPRWGEVPEPKDTLEVPCDAIARALIAAHVERSDRLKDDPTAIDLLTHPMGQIVSRQIPGVEGFDGLEITVCLFNFDTEDTDRWTY